MKLNHIACCLCFTVICFNLKAQLFKVDIDKKIGKASIIVEGKIISQKAFWNPEHTVIYTANTLHIYKVFKGNITSTQIEILTQGGSIGNRCLVVSEVLQLRKGETGMFFCNESSLHLHSPSTNNILFDVYSAQQGFFKYNLQSKEAYTPFADYKNISKNLYTIITAKTGFAEKIIDPLFDIDDNISLSGVTGTATITSFSPDTVHAGAITDVANNLLTINGSGFGDNPSGSAGVNFKDGNNDHTDPDYTIAYNSPYIISWSDSKITIDVPDRAATGNIGVVLSDGTSVTSTTNLQVFYSVLNAEFDLSNGDTVVREPRLMDANGSGGYSFSYSNSTAGNGVDFSASPAKATFLRAVQTWKDIEGANFTEGSVTSLQAVKDDRINLIVFDNDNTGVPKMADGVLEATYSWFSACSSTDDLLPAQKTGFDILVRNDKVSEGSEITLNDGPCFPERSNYDLEMIILHELGHALNLAHINDDYEASTNNYTDINPSKVMHYAILDYVDRRSPDAAAYQGVAYTIKPQGNTYGNCNLFTEEMKPLTTIQVSTDDCPSTFSSTPIADNTKVFFDLVHATSNKFEDPSFTQVNCNNSGTFVTNNAYYAFTSSSKTSLSLNISGYTTIPADLAACDGSGIRMALYDVASCPAGQNFPQPLNCATFNANGTLSVSNIQASHKYLLYFDGLRNTKASFSVTFNGNGNTTPSNNTSVKVFSNPVANGQTTTIEIDDASGSFYEYALFDIVGRLLIHDKVSVAQTTQTFNLNLNNFPAGVYVLKLADSNGKKVSNTKILKL